MRASAPVPPTALPIRAARPDEAEALAALCARSVRELALRAYTREQAEVWAGLLAESVPGWLAAGEAWVLEQGGEPAGLCVVQADGLVQALYLRPESAGCGHAQVLLAHALEQARRRGCLSFSTHASHLSRPVFERAGFRVAEAEQVVRGGLVFERFRMSASARPFRRKRSVPLGGTAHSARVPHGPLSGP